MVKWNSHLVLRADIFNATQAKFTGGFLTANDKKNIYHFIFKWMLNVLATATTDAIATYSFCNTNASCSNVMFQDAKIPRWKNHSILFIAFYTNVRPRIVSSPTLCLCTQCLTCSHKMLVVQEKLEFRKKILRIVQILTRSIQIFLICDHSAIVQHDV